MNKKTIYYFALKVLVISIVLIIVMSVLKNLTTLYSYLLPILFNTLIIIFRVINTISIILLIVLLCYFIYQIYRYMSSTFYTHLSINVFEAIYHGFADIHIIYDQLARLTYVKELTVSMRDGILSFREGQNHYCIKFVELFGKINNRIENDMWDHLSKPKKQFGRTVYQNRIRFQNPIKEMNRYIEKQLVKKKY